MRPTSRSWLSAVKTCSRSGPRQTRGSSSFHSTPSLDLPESSSSARDVAVGARHASTSTCATKSILLSAVCAAYTIYRVHENRSVF
eukprot:6187555-Pleurochrysis_carterae.AAC.2